MSKISGSCLCVAVTFECEREFSSFHLCHCEQCQKTTGSAHAANLFTNINNIHWLSGEALIRRYDVPGRAISSAFCGDCGSPVPYVSKSGQSLVIPAGSLNEPVAIAPQDQLFWHERADWYEEGIAANKIEGFPE
ncbi:GFA family protein [Halioxenophilus sp. WMMB6]|uniref:GFA family protein n=1 Tax=Halioxenophilus sp. WMMB6 TaxID=3073815 RepID=UPI00295E8BFA|nr:GFA family protein [Halioxenophilus sp. WMMB6]